MQSSTSVDILTSRLLECEASGLNFSSGLLLSTLLLTFWVQVVYSADWHPTNHISFYSNWQERWSTKYKKHLKLIFKRPGPWVARKSPWKYQLVWRGPTIKKEKVKNWGLLTEDSAYIDVPKKVKGLVPRLFSQVLPKGNSPKILQVVFAASPPARPSAYKQTLWPDHCLQEGQGGLD